MSTTIPAGLGASLAGSPDAAVPVIATTDLIRAMLDAGAGISDLRENQPPRGGLHRAGHLQLHLAAEREEDLGGREMEDILAGIDLFLFTSHFEGFPNALLEAMTAGCVPVAWRLEGITDYILDHGITGFLCELGDYDDFCSRVSELDRSRELLRRMSAALVMARAPRGETPTSKDSCIRVGATMS